MRRTIFRLSLVLGASLVSLNGQGATLALKSVKVQLPDSAQTFSGPGADAVNNNCLGCHTAEMVLNQPDLTEVAWKGEVNKMINVFKAPVATGDVDAIVAYLVRTEGKK